MKTEYYTCDGCNKDIKGIIITIKKEYDVRAIEKMDSFDKILEQLEIPKRYEVEIKHYHPLCYKKLNNE